MKIQIMDTYLTQEFLSPLLCKDLHYAGITDNIPYAWVQDGTDFKLQTFAYDTEDIYQQAWHNRQTMHGITKAITIPAYRIAELDRIIPGYGLVKEMDYYIAMLNTEFGQSEARAERMADALGILIRDMLQKRIIDADYANRQFIIKKLPNR